MAPPGSQSPRGRAGLDPRWPPRVPHISQPLQGDTPLPAQNCSVQPPSNGWHLQAGILWCGGQQLQAGSPATLSRGPGGPAACKVPWNTKALLGPSASTCPDPGPSGHCSGPLWPLSIKVSVGLAPAPDHWECLPFAPLNQASTCHGEVSIRPDPPTCGTLDILLHPRDPRWALSQGLSRCRKGPRGPSGGQCPSWLPTYVTRPLQATHPPTLSLTRVRSDGQTGAGEQAATRLLPPSTAAIIVWKNSTFQASVSTRAHGRTCRGMCASVWVHLDVYT